jgi:hypothetical protein
MLKNSSQLYQYTTILPISQQQKRRSLIPAFEFPNIFLGSIQARPAARVLRATKMKLLDSG